MSEDQKIGQLEEALREMSLSENKIEMSRSDKKGLKLVNKESFVCDGRFVVPVQLSKVTNDYLIMCFQRKKKVSEPSKKSYGR